MKNYLTDILIAPVGHQPMPVLLPILEHRPEQVFLIPSTEVRGEASAVRQVARQAGHKRVTVMEAVDAYSAEGVAARIREVCTRFDPANQQVMVNISGGTTVMAMGAQRAARKLGLPMLYVNTEDTLAAQSPIAADLAHNTGLYGPEIIFFAPDGQVHDRARLRTKVTIAQYAAAHEALSEVNNRWSTAWDDDPRWCVGLARAEPYLSAARALGAAGSESARVMDQIRANFSAEVFGFSEISLAQQRLLDALCDAGFLLTLPGATTRYCIGTIDYAREFLEGHWLEVFVADACQQSPWFDEVRCGVKLLRKDEHQRRPVDNDLDVAAISRGRLAVISCKTGKEVADSREKSKFSLYELGALLQADLMGLYARKVLVTNQPAFNTDLSNRAYYGQTCLVSGMRLSEVARIVRDHLDTPQLGI